MSKGMGLGVRPSYKSYLYSFNFLPFITKVHSFWPVILVKGSTQHGFNCCLRRLTQITSLTTLWMTILNQCLSWFLFGHLSWFLDASHSMNPRSNSLLLKCAAKLCGSFDLSDWNVNGLLEGHLFCQLCRSLRNERVHLPWILTVRKSCFPAPDWSINFVARLATPQPVMSQQLFCLWQRMKSACVDITDWCVVRSTMWLKAFTDEEGCTQEVMAGITLCFNIFC